MASEFGGRFSRQSRLAEVGDAKQERLSRSRVDVAASGFEGWVEGRYLAGAGVGVLRVADPSTQHAATRLRSAIAIETVPAASSPPRDAEGASPSAEPDDKPRFFDRSAEAYARAARRALRRLRAILEEGTP